MGRIPLRVDLSHADGQPKLLVLRCQLLITCMCSHLYSAITRSIIDANSLGDDDDILLDAIVLSLLGTIKDCDRSMRIVAWEQSIAFVLNFYMFAISHSNS